MKNAFFRISIFSIVTISMMMFGELVVRLIDAYDLMSPTLTITIDFKRNQFPELDDYSIRQFSLEDFATRYHSSRIVDYSWIKIDPPLPTRNEPPPEFVSRYSDAKGDSYVNYLWNDYLVKQVLKGRTDWGNFSFIEKDFPDPIFVYSAPWKNMFPRYRYPQNVALPSGIRTNQFGWRGESIELKNPEKNHQNCLCVSFNNSKSA